MRKTAFAAIAFIAIFCLCESTIAAPADSLSKRISEFWASTKQQLATVPMDAVVTPSPESLPYHAYKVTLRGLNGVQFYAMLSIPVQGEAPAKAWPVIITTCGYGIGAGQGIMLGDCLRGYAVLQVYPRGQGISSEFFKIEGDKLTSHGEQPDGFYYQGAYADMMRAIDFVMTRADLDHNRVVMMSTSQGAGTCLAIASLDDRVKAVVAHVPFLCNMRLAATMPSLVKTVLDKHKDKADTYLKTLDYFDPYYLVENLHCPVLMSAGGKDTTCPLVTVQSVYDKLKTKKQLKVYPGLAHTTCLDFYKISWPWLEKQLKK
ncbi:acetylxylan esterase [Mucilaginibacter mali]|uniref:Acetylxylan esterase n=1 Tax=Mucilaginibacter mali TaxID=2740462 RepID=A0A7D4TS74_9SPHI|nr:acetylxylan esterase [Mucilaginibacter mali]QKJ32614.1 acetylxylan esterase [Mucilaginibacter mali]